MLTLFKTRLSSWVYKNGFGMLAYYKLGHGGINKQNLKYQNRFLKNQWTKQIRVCFMIALPVPCHLPSQVSFTCLLVTFFHLHNDHCSVQAVAQIP